ncbi:MAG: hypothetical protein G01um101466_494 [Parcubacteria group bacterium Gr01-1014_66]|nr:MAG: hypothetical protein G01um101466_494 [Parcubacteria group bacterium Gr01-1014_66]
MKNFLTIFWLGIKELFKNSNYVTLFVIISLLMLGLFVLMPVWTVSGNTLAYQLKIFTPRDYAVLVLLSGLSALFITMQVFVMKLRKKVAGLGGTVGGGLGALFAGIMGTAFCASCLAPLFAFFGIGFGGVVFVLNYRWYFVVGITLLMLTAIYLTTRKINKVCTSC